MCMLYIASLPGLSRFCSLVCVQHMGSAHDTERKPENKNGEAWE